MNFSWLSWWLSPNLVKIGDSQEPPFADISDELLLPTSSLIDSIYIHVHYLTKKVIAFGFRFLSIKIKKVIAIEFLIIILMIIP